MKIVYISGPEMSGKTYALKVITDGLFGKKVLNITGVPAELVVRQISEWGPISYVYCDDASPEVIKVLEKLDVPDTRAYVVIPARGGQPNEVKKLQERIDELLRERDALHLLFGDKSRQLDVAIEQRDTLLADMKQIIEIGYKMDFDPVLFARDSVAKLKASQS